MKALSVRQPWATMIARGLKTVEVRSWFTHHRGPLLLCASRRRDAPGPEPVGVAICVVDLVDVVPFDPEQHAKRASVIPIDPREDYAGIWAWMFDRPRIVYPVPVSGRLSLFEVPDHVITVPQ